MNHRQSEALFNEALQYIPGGVNSPVRSFANANMSPIFVDHAFGSHVYDVDEHTYLDYIGSWGPMILGHAHPMLEASLKEAIGKGISYGLCARDEVRLAKLICEAYPSAEMVRMVNSGSEATMSAIRLARGYTGRNKIIKFEGCYHGHSDGLLVAAGSGALTFQTPTSPGVPLEVIQHTLVCNFNDINSIQQCIQQYPDDIAAIIIEPVAANMGVIESDPIFLQALRKLCDEHHIVLIFDEVITGFRLMYGGAAAYYGIQPDVVCFGKIIGAGLPVGAYGGKRAIMSQVSPSGPVYQAGTLSGNPLAMHVGCTLLTYLRDHPECYEQLHESGTYVKDGIQRLLDQKHLPYQIHQTKSLLTLFFTDQNVRTYQDVMTCDQVAFQTYFKALFDQQILIAPSPYEAMFLSCAHTKEELDQTLAAMDRALDQLK